MAQQKAVGFSLEPVVASEQISALAAMAERIWQEHYRAIIGAEQTRYMIDRYQSAGAIRQQLSQGYRYFFLLCDGQRAGYAGITVNSDELFLSKLYLLKDYRRRGLAKMAVAELSTLARASGSGKIRLTVNRGNAGSIAAYERIGFVRVREQKADIGNGFFMDDYVYELPVKPGEKTGCNFDGD